MLPALEEMLSRHFPIEDSREPAEGSEEATAFARLLRGLLCAFVRYEEYHSVYTDWAKNPQQVGLYIVPFVQVAGTFLHLFRGRLRPGMWGVPSWQCLRSNLVAHWFEAPSHAPRLCITFPHLPEFLAVAVAILSYCRNTCHSTPGNTAWAFIYLGRSPLRSREPRKLGLGIALVSRAGLEPLPCVYCSTLVQAATRTAV